MDTGTDNKAQQTVDTIRTRAEGNKRQVFDPLRKRWVAFTPEEWVRQHFIRFLMEKKAYPAGRINNEVPLKVGEMQKRCDTVVYGDYAEPLVIIEYKAPTIVITQKVFDQTWRYNLPLHVPYIIISNGHQHFCCKIDYEKNQTTFLEDIPLYSELLQ